MGPPDQSCMRRMGPSVASDNVHPSRVSGSASTGTPLPAARRRQTRVTTATDVLAERAEHAEQAEQAVRAERAEQAERPLRVGLLSYRSKPHCGGQGIYLRHVSRELAALGHHV